jgi:hypothetical protein
MKKIADVGIGGRAELIDTRVVDQDVDRARLGGKPTHVVGVGEIGSDETCLPPAFWISCTTSAPRSALRP